MSQNRPTAPDIVTAVLVAHDGARWLPETLDAVHRQTRPVDRFVAADNGSRDRGPALLNEALGAERIITLPRSTGYGEAIVNALRLPAASVAVPVPAAAGDPAPVEWLWLLHDDSAPDPYALIGLLETAARDPRARVIGPKVRDWHDRRVLLEAGVTIDRAGRRETGLEPRELDQGQRDGDREVLAVGSAGMLVRRDVWDELGGFDPRIALFRDDIDFCWRAGGAGHKVLLTTTAIVYHAEAGSRRRRRLATGGHPLRVDRQNALYVLFANLPAGALLVSMVRGFFGSLLRVLLFLLAKQPGAAIDELAAVAHAYGRPVRLIAARRDRAKNRKRSYSAIRPYMARGLAAARLAAMIGDVFGGGGPMASAGRHHAGTFGEEEDEDAELLSDSHGPLRRALSNPGVLLFLALAVITVAAERSLLFGGALGGGALTPVTGGASDLWRQYAEGYHQTGLGSADAAPPATALVALVAGVLGGSVSAAIGLLLLGCVPIAGLVVYVVTRGILPHRPARVWLAASYALLPVATGAIAAGRLGTAVAIVVIPVIGVYFAKMLGQYGARARRAAWAAGLLLAVAMAFVPLVWLLALVIGGLVAVAHSGWRTTAGAEEGRGEGDRSLLINVGIVVLTPPILLGPWAWALFVHPSRFLLETGLHRAGLSDPALSAQSLLLLSPGGPGVPPIWMTAGFLVAGLVALSLPRNRVMIAAGWGVALFGLLVAILVSRAAPEPATGGPAIPAWPGVALAVAAGGLLMTAAIAAGPVGDLVRHGGWRRVAGLAVVVIACSGPVLTAGAWVWRGAGEPLNRHPDTVMPPAVAALSGNRTSTLVVRPENGAVAYAVLRGRVPYFGEDQLSPPDETHVRMDALVSGLMSGRGGDDGHALAQYGIRFVLVPGPAVAGSLHRLDGVPGMSRMSLTSEYAVWRITSPTARVWIGGSGGSVTAVPGAPKTTIPAGPAGRTLETAEPYDTGWSATLNGHELAPVKSHGWAQAFRLPASGGRLDIERGTFWHDTWLWTQGLALVVVIVLALPGARRDPETEDAEEPRTARAKRKRQHQPRRARGHRRIEPVQREMHELPGPAPETAGPMALTVNAFQALQVGQYRAEDEPDAAREPERPEDVRERGARPRPAELGWSGSLDPAGGSGPAAGPEPPAGSGLADGSEPAVGPEWAAGAEPWAAELGRGSEPGAGVRPPAGWGLGAEAALDRYLDAGGFGAGPEAVRDRGLGTEDVRDRESGSDQGEGPEDGYGRGAGTDGWSPGEGSEAGYGEAGTDRGGTPEADGTPEAGGYGAGRGFGAGRSGLASYVREPDWSAGRGDEPRPDPLAGTPLSREIPVNTSEAPTPLAGGHPYGYEYAAGDSGAWPSDRGHDSGAPAGDGERPEAPDGAEGPSRREASVSVGEGDSAGSEMPSGGDVPAEREMPTGEQPEIGLPGISDGAEGTSEVEAAAPAAEWTGISDEAEEPPAVEVSVPAADVAGAAASADEGAAGEVPAESSVAGEDARPGEVAAEPDAVLAEAEGVEPSYGAEVRAERDAPAAGEGPDSAGAESDGEPSVSETDDGLSLWTVGEEQPPGDESDEMVSDDADEEPVRDAPVDDERAGRPR